MKKIFITVTLLFLTLTGITAEETGKAGYKQEDVVELLNCVSCTIRAGCSQGSGVVYKTGDYDFVWTAAHVVDGLRKTREVVDPKTGTKRIVIEFDPVKIVQEFLENGERVEERVLLADVIRYSNADTGEDLALLKIRRKKAFNCSVKFYQEDKIPKIGSKVIHVGSFLGQGGANSTTSGDYSQIGRMYQNKVYDQVSSPSFPGSSGGGVYLSDGQYVGMLVRGAGETFGLIVPIRRIRDWASKAGVLWALNATLKPPTEAEIKALPVEDTGVVWPTNAERIGPPKPAKFPFMIKVDNE